MEELIKDIYSARYGKETREPVSEALAMLSRIMNQKIENTEVVQARGPFGTLRERIDSRHPVIQDAGETLAEYNAIFGRGA